MAFREFRLDLGYDYGAAGGGMFSTDIATTESGYESRNQNWVNSLGQWAIGERNIDQTKKDYLLNFHHHQRGMLDGFRWLDWADFRVVDEGLTTAENDTTIQLIKTYGTGTNPYVRTVVKPAELTPGGDAGYLFDAITIKRNGVLETGWTLDTTTGIVTLASAVVLNDVFTWSGEFHKPVRFDADKMQFKFIGYDPYNHAAIFYLSAMNLVEMRL